jgi:hypothetical protein
VGDVPAGHRKDTTVSTDHDRPGLAAQWLLGHQEGARYEKMRAIRAEIARGAELFQHGPVGDEFFARIEHLVGEAYKLGEEHGLAAKIEAWGKGDR